MFFIEESDDGAMFSQAQLKSLRQVGKMVRESGGKWFGSRDELVIYLNLQLGDNTQDIVDDE